jgi:hypothetical protein
MVEILKSFVISCFHGCGTQNDGTKSLSARYGSRLRLSARTCWLVGLLCLSTPLADSLVAGERSFYAGYVGVTPNSKSDLAKTYFNRSEVKLLIYALESGPLSIANARQILSGGDTRLDDLVRLKLVKIDDNAIRLGFAYFTAADMRRVHEVAAKHVPSLVAAYLAHADKFAGILSHYPAKGVDQSQLAFVLIAGFSLNWDALSLLEKRGDRVPIMVEGPDWKYSFWASESTPEYSYKGCYWGSSTFPGDSRNLDPPLNCNFSSFGDAESDPRMNFPDLFAIPPQDMTQSVRTAATSLGLRDDNRFGLKGVLGLELSRSVADVLFALHSGPQGKDRLCNSIEPADRAHCGELLQLLTVLGYIEPGKEDSYALKISVFDGSDKPMLEETLALSREIINDWLAANYSKIKAELSGLTAVNQGVPYEALFGQIWHELFGLTTRELAEKKVIADPYAPGSSSKGSIPALWRTSVYHHDWR